MQPKFPLPYYAVIFTSQMTADSADYQEMAAQMSKLASEQKGFLGMDSARADVGITVSYWESEEAILGWKNVQEHLVAQALGRSRFYANYTVRVCKVERQYDFNRQGE